MSRKPSSGHDAIQLLTARDNDVRSMANQPALRRLLEERRRQEERQEAVAAEAVRAHQFHDRVDAARSGSEIPLVFCVGGRQRTSR